ncbi:MAG: hypothetical protein EB059_04865 [Alphaproteobacteria bacterium]|nr:hypothetical protein [Alphaproteobacteria bacterium]
MSSSICNTWTIAKIITQPRQAAHDFLHKPGTAEEIGKLFGQAIGLAVGIYGEVLALKIAPLVLFNDPIITHGYYRGCVAILNVAFTMLAQSRRPNIGDIAVIGEQATELGWALAKGASLPIAFATRYLGGRLGPGIAKATRGTINVLRGTKLSKPSL